MACGETPSTNKVTDARMDYALIRLFVVNSWMVLVEKNHPRMGSRILEWTTPHSFIRGEFVDGSCGESRPRIRSRILEWMTRHSFIRVEFVDDSPVEKNHPRMGSRILEWTTPHSFIRGRFSNPPSTNCLPVSSMFPCLRVSLFTCLPTPTHSSSLKTSRFGDALQKRQNYTNPNQTLRRFATFARLFGELT